MRQNRWNVGSPARKLPQKARRDRTGGQCWRAHVCPACVGVLAWLTLSPAIAEGNVIHFSGHDWTVRGSDWSRGQHLGRDALRLKRASAILKDVSFYNGTIGFDVAVSGNRGFTSVRWRRQADFSGENFLVRNHKSDERDALQYEAFHGFRSSWQLYNKDGYTAAASIPINEWIPIKVVVKNRQADIYFASDLPVIHVTELKGADLPGFVQLNGALDGAYFSNFWIDSLEPETLLGNAMELPAPSLRPESIKEWLIAKSPVLATSWPETLESEKYLGAGMTWIRAAADSNGIVNLSEHIPAPNFGRPDDELSIAVAKTTLVSDRDRRIALRFGYSDHVAIFVNGTLLFNGTNRFREDDRRYQGLVDLHRQITVPLKKGPNELFLVLGEADRFGWGFATELPNVDGLQLLVPADSQP